MKEPLTKKQRKVYDYLLQYYIRHGYMPSHVEIAKRFKILVGGSTIHHLWKLEEKGWIKRKKSHARHIILL